MVSIITLGILNVIYSENPPESKLAMKNLLLTGILATWVAMFLVTNKQRRDILSWFCCGCLVIIAAYEIIAYIPIAITNRIDSPNWITVFTLNAIPTGTLMILLSPGPVHLILSRSSRIKLLGYAAAFLGILLILLTQKRGTVLAIISMGLIWALYRFVWVRYFFGVALLAAALIIPFKGVDLSGQLNPEVPSHGSILHRFELYPFALHVWKHHPVLGIGLRASNHEKYLETYKQHNPGLTTFSEEVKQIQTFDNMLVTSFVELGTIMTLLYLCLIILIFGKYWLKLRSSKPYPEDIYRIIVLLGVAIHSMTYDSLLFPPVNWLFHLHLGILAGYTVPGNPPAAPVSD